MEEHLPVDGAGGFVPGVRLREVRNVLQLFQRFQVRENTPGMFDEVGREHVHAVVVVANVAQEHFQSLSALAGVETTVAELLVATHEQFVGDPVLLCQLPDLPPAAELFQDR